MKVGLRVGLIKYAKSFFLFREPAYASCSEPFLKVLVHERRFGSENMKTVFTIEGNIGTGKSTTLEILKTRYKTDNRVAFVDEDVKGWEECGLLQGLYDGTLHKGMFQACALMPQVVKLHEALQKPDVEMVVTERSPWSNYGVFARSNLDSVHMDAYMYLYEGMMSLLQYDLNVQLTFLDVSPEVASARIQERSRNSEKTVDLDYISLIDQYHRDFIYRTYTQFNRSSFHKFHTPITIPPGSKEEVVEKLQEYVDRTLTPNSPFSVI